MRDIPTQMRIERNVQHAQQRCFDAEGTARLGLSPGSSPRISSSVSSASRASMVSRRAKPFFLRPALIFVCFPSAFFFVCFPSFRSAELDAACDIRGSSSSSLSVHLIVGSTGLGESGDVVASSAAEIVLQSLIASPALRRNATTACGPIFLAIFWSCSRLTGIASGDTCGAVKDRKSFSSVEGAPRGSTPRTALAVSSMLLRVAMARARTRRAGATTKGVSHAMRALRAPPGK